jgi:hypothetical protein
MSMEYVPAAVLDPTFQVQDTAPLPSAFLGPRPAAFEGPLLYVTVIEHDAAGAVATVTVAFELGVTGEVTDLTVVTAELTGRGVAVGFAVGVGLAVAVAAGVGLDALLGEGDGVEAAEVGVLLG